MQDRQTHETGRPRGRRGPVAASEGGISVSGTGVVYVCYGAHFSFPNQSDLELTVGRVESSREGVPSLGAPASRSSFPVVQEGTKATWSQRPL